MAPSARPPRVEGVSFKRRIPGRLQRGVIQIHSAICMKLVTPRGYVKEHRIYAETGQLQARYLRKGFQCVEV